MQFLVICGRKYRKSYDLPFMDENIEYMGRYWKLKVGQANIGKIIDILVINKKNRYNLVGNLES